MKRSNVRGVQLRPPPKFCKPKMIVVGDSAKVLHQEGKTFVPRSILTSRRECRSSEYFSKSSWQPIEFTPRRDIRRFILAYGEFAPRGRLPWFERYKGTKKENRRYHEQFIADCAALPLPESYLDVPPAGEGSIDLYGELLMSRDEAIALAAKMNAQLVAKHGRDVKSARGEWMLIVEIGEPVISGGCIDLHGGIGVAETTNHSPVRVVIPGNAERRRHLIDWNEIAMPEKKLAASGCNTHG